jgi:hypothetical protein
VHAIRAAEGAGVTLSRVDRMDNMVEALAASDPLSPRSTRFLRAISQAEHRKLAEVAQHIVEKRCAGPTPDAIRSKLEPPGRLRGRTAAAWRGARTPDGGKQSTRLVLACVADVSTAGVGVIICERFANRGVHDRCATANPSFTRPRGYGTGAFGVCQLQLNGEPTSATGRWGHSRR